LPQQVLELGHRGDREPAGGQIVRPDLDPR
jgi:hypothetical protein